jgi:hypothetical protein
MNQAAPVVNPLKQYFRAFKLYLKLPSGGRFYKPGVIDLNENGEIGILQMTAKDELMLKNPDALLNGEALIEVLTSCVPSLKQPRALLTNDIDTLITAIRYATYNDTLETYLTCPKCEHENTFKINLQYALDNMTELEPEYIVYLSSGLSVYVKPYSFPELLKALHSKFEQNKLQRSIESETLSDEKKSEMFTSAFNKLSLIKFELLTNGIVRIVDQQNNIDVSEPKFIKEFLYNVVASDVEKINDLINEINVIGIKKTFSAKCEKCEHEWESEIDFNPVNFL